MSIFQQKSIEKEIHGKEFSFYSTHISHILKLKKFSMDIASGVMGFMTKDPIHYAGKTYSDGSGTVVNDISQDKINEYQAARARGISDIINVLLEEKNTLVLCELICDSLRDETFKAQELLDEGDIETLVAFAMGLFEANSSLLDPILGSLQTLKEMQTPVTETDEIDEDTETSPVSNE